MVILSFDFISAGVLPTMKEKLPPLLLLVVAAVVDVIRGPSERRCRGADEGHILVFCWEWVTRELGKQADATLKQQARG